MEARCDAGFCADLLSLKRLSISSSCAHNPHNPFSPHCCGEKVRMRGSSLTFAREWLRLNGFQTEPLTPTLSPQALRGEGDRCSELSFARKSTASEGEGGPHIHHGVTAESSI